MSRLASLLIVLLAIAVATPVLAEDRLSLNGQMRVRAWHVDVDGADNTETWADQRLRIGGKFSVAEGVSVTFRMDATEANWGANGGIGGANDLGSGRIPRASNSMQWDRAHLDIQKGMLHLRAGQLYAGLGQSGFDANDNGLMLNIKGQVPVSLFFMVDNDGGSKADSDAYYYGANVAHKTDAYAANVFVGGQKDDAEEVYVLGLNYAQTMDALKLFAEVDYFTGDASATMDAYGLQLFVDVSMAASETVTVGGQLFYAMGDDEDTQYVILGNDFGGWDPIFALGTGLDNEQIDLGRPFALMGDGAGIMAARLYGNFMVTSDLTLGASVFYGVSEEDSAAVEVYEDGMAVAAGMSYAVMANTKLGVQLQYEEFTAGALGGQDAEALKAGMGLFVNF